MLKLDLEGAERFVEGYGNAFWDGWTMVLFKPSRAAEFNRRGLRHNDRWGYATRVDADNNGVFKFRV